MLIPGPSQKLTSSTEACIEVNKICDTLETYAPCKAIISLSKVFRQQMILCDNNDQTKFSDTFTSAGFLQFGETSLFRFSFQHNPQSPADVQAPVQAEKIMFDPYEKWIHQDISRTQGYFMGQHIKYLSPNMRFPSMWYVRPAKPQISRCLRTVWSEPLLVAWIFCEC